MAIGTGTAMALGMGANMLGGLLKGRGANKAAKKQNAYNQQAQQQFMGMMQPGVSPLETMGMNMLQGMQGAPGAGMNMMAPDGGGPGLMPGGMPMVNMMAPGQNFNTGQDGLMQSLRSDPQTKVDETLGGIGHEGGNPFNTSELFRALGVMDQENTNQAVAQTRAGASGLGHRFGSYMANQEGNMRTQANNAAAARNAQIGMQSHEGAQARAMQALGMLSGREQFNTQAGMQGQQNQMQLLQTLLGAQQGRMGQNMQLAQLGYGAGQPVAAPGYGGAFQDAGQMASMWAMMQPRRRTGR
jgi:hypothetical protein